MKRIAEVAPVQSVSSSRELYRVEERPGLGHLDLLGRVPVPLRRPFKAGLDRAVTAHALRTGGRLECQMLTGAEWYLPFDCLAGARREDLPGMLITTLFQDVMAPELLAHYTPGRPPEPAFDRARRSSGLGGTHGSHPVCVDAGLPDPSGTFRLFSVIPFVFLVDERRLRGRAAPRVWADLLAPQWADDIVFGGWRPHAQAPYQDYNSYLLLCLYQAFGADGLYAFADNVLHLQHNVRTAARMGSNSDSVGAIAVLPWMQAELCPRREHTRAVWPEDGALVMPMGYMVKPESEARVQPLSAYLTGHELGHVLARNCYPPTGLDVPGAFPPGVRLRWPGWDWVRQHDLAAESRQAGSMFFHAWYARQTTSTVLS